MNVGIFTGTLQVVQTKQGNLVLLKRKLLILDCNGLLWSSKRAKHALQPGQSSSQHGVHQIQNAIYFERLGLHQFLARCFERFDVAIWTCAGKARTNAMVETIFTEEERNKFKFVWDNSFTTDSRVLKSDGSCNVMLKNLRMVWEAQRYAGFYDDSNTILIDDSPVKTFINPDFTSLFPTPFKFGDCEDTFLPHILWPLLLKLSLALDVRRFLQINTPKWSLKNCKYDERINSEVYATMKTKFSVTKPSVPKYTILDVSEYEVTWHEKFLISKIPPSHKCTERNIRELALSLLGRSYEGPYLNDPLQFINMIWRIRMSSEKFDLVDAVTSCNRDEIVDEDRSKLTCSNLRCTLCT